MTIDNRPISLETLFAGLEVTPITGSVEIGANKKLPRGTVLGKAAEAETYDIVVTGITAEYILANDVETGDEPESVVVYKTGMFNAGALTVGEDDTLDSHLAELRDVNIFVKAEV